MSHINVNISQLIQFSSSHYLVRHNTIIDISQNYLTTVLNTLKNVAITDGSDLYRPTIQQEKTFQFSRCASAVLECAATKTKPVVEGPVGLQQVLALNVALQRC
jgi:hypothetical protein